MEADGLRHVLPTSSRSGLSAPSSTSARTGPGTPQRARRGGAVGVPEVGQLLLAPVRPQDVEVLDDLRVPRLASTFAPRTVAASLGVARFSRLVCFDPRRGRVEIEVGTLGGPVRVIQAVDRRCAGADRREIEPDQVEATARGRPRAGPTDAGTSSIPDAPGPPGSSPATDRSPPVARCPEHPDRAVSRRTGLVERETATARSHISANRRRRGPPSRRRSRRRDPRTAAGRRTDRAGPPGRSPGSVEAGRPAVRCRPRSTPAPRSRSPRTGRIRGGRAPAEHASTRTVTTALPAYPDGFSAM